MADGGGRSPLERLLGLFAQVKAGEGGTVLLLALNLFLVLASYYVAKVVREALILAGGGAELKSYVSAVQVLLLIGAVRFYAWLAGRVSRRRLITTVNLFFTGCLIGFYLLAQARVPYIGVAFFIWVGMFSVMVVAQFWSYANDVYTPEEGKRLFAIVAFGASLGAVAGSYLPKHLIPLLGMYQLLLVAGGILLASLLVTTYVDKRIRRQAGAVPSQEIKTESRGGSEPEPEEMGKGAAAFKLVFRNKYLLMIAFLILLLNWVNTTGEYILGRMIEEAAKALGAADESFSVGDYIGQFYSSFFTVVNIAGVLIQLFLVSRIFKYLGIRVAVLILPIIAMGGYLLAALYPVLGLVRWTKTAENATDYSLNNTVRHALFLPTTREEKYKAKQVVDSFFHRAGDVLSAVLVYAGVTWLSFNTSQFAVFNLALVAVWLVLAIRIGQINKRMMRERDAA
jgi:AAA family ATP:ADP antiporter